MNSVRKILSVFIVLTFLMSASGVFYIKHTCLQSGEVTIQLTKQHDCCEQKVNKQSCCGTNNVDNKYLLHEDHHNCCVNNFVYLKDDSDYIKSEINLPAKIFDYPLFEIKVPDLIASSEHIRTNALTPPYYKPPRDVLIKNNILIL